MIRIDGEELRVAHETSDAVMIDEHDRVAEEATTHAPSDGLCPIQERSERASRLAPANGADRKGDGIVMVLRESSSSERKILGRHAVEHRARSQHVAMSFDRNVAIAESAPQKPLQRTIR